MIYSGTVSAATEGAILGIPSIAMSLTSYTWKNFSTAAHFARDLAQTVKDHPLPKGVFLNVNVPAVEEKNIQGVRITRQGHSNWMDDYHMYKAPNKREYYWLVGERREIPDDDNIDDGAIEQNKISITPIHYDLTFYPLLEKMKKWDIER
ncbi:MAG: 5'/3'-nucleotidase SurE [candidate division KSB1 bacterium]|nr:5'/3'-nucleotidase SurE [candidate division KSB1 bacterium]